MDFEGKNYCARCMRILEKPGPCPYCGYDERTRATGVHLDAGTLLHGRYQLGAVRGQGGFGITYAAWDEVLGIPVAIKEYFPAEYAGRDRENGDTVLVEEKNQIAFLTGRLRFERESRVLASVQGLEGIVKVLDYFSENETAYIVMEFIRGVPVDEWAQQHSMDAHAVLRLLRPVADSLIAMHGQGIVHRDLKPDNLLVDETGKVRIIDFGAAMLTEKTSATAILTRRYAPPEQYGEAFGRQGPWSDVYGFCAVAYRLLAGVPPEDAMERMHRDTLKALGEQGVKIRRSESQALMTGLQLDVKKRTQSMEELRARLYHLPLPEQTLWRRRVIRRFLAAGVALGAMLALLFVNFLWGLPAGRGLRASLRRDGFVVTGTMGSAQALTVPGTIWGIPVTGIHANAFRGNQSLQAVTVSEGVRNIGDLALADCSALQTVALPGSVTQIGRDVLAGDPAALLVWGERGSAAEAYAMENGWGFVDRQELILTETANGMTVTGITTRADTLVIPSSVDGIPITALGEKLQVRGVRILVLPDSIREIPEGLCRQNYRLEKVVLGAHVQHIGASSFEGCISLAQIQWPQTLVSIGARAFYHCASLTEAVLPSSVQSLGAQAFSGCTQLVRVSIPEGVTELPPGVLENTAALAEAILPDSLEIMGTAALAGSGLATVRLPAGLRRMEEKAFAGSALSYLVLPAALESIGAGAFSGCESLAYLQLLGDTPVWSEDSLERTSPELVIAGGAESVARDMAQNTGAVWENTSLWSERMLLEGNVASMGLDMEDSVVVPWMNVAENCPIEAIGAKRCESAEIRLSGFQTRIEAGAFREWISLTRVTAPSGLTAIGDYAFFGCSGLQEIPDISQTVQIGAYAFAHCTSLSRAILPDTLKKLGENAFMECTGLEELKLGNGVRYLPDYAFSDCPLGDVVIPGQVHEIGKAFFRSPGLFSVSVEEGVRNIRNEAMGQCENLRSVSLPESLTVLEPDAFRDCEALCDLAVLNPELSLDGVWLPENVVIHARRGSAAQAAAEQYGYTFAAMEKDGT